MQALTPPLAVDKVHDVAPLPSQPPRFRDIFDLKMLACFGLLLGLGVGSCDLVNRAVDRRVLPQPAQPDPTTWIEGSKARVILALKTHDADRNNCASAETFDVYRCEFDGNKRRFIRPAGSPADDNLRHTLQPYRTAVGEHLLAIGGLWHTPELAFRRHREPARDRRGAPLQTFYAECDVTFVGKLASVDVRWEFGKNWSSSKDVPVARAEQCTILEAPELTSSSSS